MPFTRALVVACLSVCVLSVQAAEDPTPPPSVEPAILPMAESQYAAEVAKGEALVAKAEAELAKARKLAGEARLKAYKDRLVEVTKAGDFDKAVAVKARIEQLEKEPEGDRPKTSKRPRPKDTVKFGGHSYALIKEPATWHIAKKRCEEMGGHLACVGSNKEAQFLAALCGEICTFFGASSEENSAEWKWVDGSHGFNGLQVDIRPDTEAMFLAFDHRWLNGRSGTKCPYVCEWDK